MTTTPTRACAHCRQHKPLAEFLLGRRWVGSCDACRLALREELAAGSKPATGKARQNPGTTNLPTSERLKTAPTLYGIFAPEDARGSSKAKRSSTTPPSSSVERMPAHTLRNQGLYDGTELQPYEGRPGAMDAYRLPSLAMGERVWPRGVKPV